jgi:hypothetical protein
MALQIQCGDTVKDVATGRLARVQSMRGENPIANQVPGFTVTEWHVTDLDESEPKSKVFYNESDLMFMKSAPK